MFTALVLFAPYLLSANEVVSYDLPCAVGVHAAINDIQRMINFRDPPSTPSKLRSSIVGMYCRAISDGEKKQVVVEITGPKVNYVITTVNVSDLSVVIAYDRKCPGTPAENPTCLD